MQQMTNCNKNQKNDRVEKNCMGNGFDSVHESLNIFEGTVQNLYTTEQISDEQVIFLYRFILQIVARLPSIGNFIKNLLEGFNNFLFALLIARYRLSMVNFVRRHRIQDPENVVQELWREFSANAFNTFDPQRGTFSNWLFRALRNRSYDEIRRLERMRSISALDDKTLDTFNGTRVTVSLGVDMLDSIKEAILAASDNSQKVLAILSLTLLNAKTVSPLLIECLNQPYNIRVSEYLPTLIKTQFKMLDLDSLIGQVFERNDKEFYSLYRQFDPEPSDTRLWRMRASANLYLSGYLTNQGWH